MSSAHKVRFLNELEVSRLTGRAIQTLRNDRYLKRGLPFYKIGKSVRYRLDEVIECIEGGKVETQHKQREATT